MTDTFIRLIAALACCNSPEPDLNEHARWTAVLQAIYRLRDVQAHSFLAAINLAGVPNESPSALLLRSHQHAKQVLPKLLVEYREAKRKEAADTNQNKFLRQQTASDPFVEGANLTRDAYAGLAEAEPEQAIKIDSWGNVIQS